LGSLLFHERADALDDLARALGLARRFSSAPSRSSSVICLP
jgi:hypothetical protein